MRPDIIPVSKVNDRILFNACAPYILLGYVYGLKMLLFLMHPVHGAFTNGAFLHCDLQNYRRPPHEQVQLFKYYDSIAVLY
jgi:hypothetical protein